ncbi:FAD-dependent oxidoreductase [Gordonia sp. OPL2]|uniref:FAD-dependent oxidoreductase n=1 Tax=Gordonia sp. OPL2 TaxID=2486274 RepID=UPI001655F9AB|nr:FAD-dependent oxidoreductase [Gordonia sp. OPL2]ROZ88012.1 CoA-disulfide reductase [Gordonia sp. OPL2]
MGERILVVGADAAGMSAAHQCLRSAALAAREVDVVVLERTCDTSYSACGIPYLVAGMVNSPDDLSARTPDKHRAMGVDLRLGTTAVGIDLDKRTVDALASDGTASTIGFDQLVLATGAEPIIPDWARDRSGDLLPGVAAVKTLDDARYWLEVFADSGEMRSNRRRGVVIGGGYIGVEAAEALQQRGFDTHLVTRSRVMSTFDSTMSARIEEAMIDDGVTVMTNTVVELVEIAHDGTKILHTAGGRTIEADVVMIGTGVRPASTLGADAGLPIGDHLGYLTDDRQQLGEGIWAAGDCCEAYDRLRGKNAFLPLGTHANKQGRICGFNLVGGDRRFAGVLGTAITRYHSASAHIEIARTGLSTTQALEVGYQPVSLTTEGGTASGYMAERSSIATHAIADKGTRKLLGVQIVGGTAAGKRIDTAAAALWGDMAVDDLAEMDLSYAPPFATVWEAIQLAARRLADAL